MWQHYRDELVTMGMVFVVSAIGLFFVTSRFLITDQQAVQEILISPTPEVLGVSDLVPTLPPPSPTIKLGIITPTPGGATISATPTPIRVPYGQEGVYGYESYQIDYLNPRLVFDDGAEKRRFVVDVVIKNISVESGLTNGLTAEIVKDGNTIVADAPLSLTESKLILPGQQLSFEARMSLIDGTDVMSLTYKPDAAEETTHELQ